MNTVIATSPHLPFYLAAGALALWALTIGGLGIVKHNLPKSDGLYTLGVVFTVLLVITTMGAAIGTGETPDLNQTRPDAKLGVVPQPGDAAAGGAAEAPKPDATK
ncbi:MAG: hypothetical protein F2799_01770 [Actinobacteria bacterium]|uniref:Unannotated protein n=1 Tax=freshwater metagenome TaxID=449393 RepID=A0A6J7D6R8_9ZZZZ|nr:hypothetical protein [Actinomycetota bacterium]